MNKRILIVTLYLLQLQHIITAQSTFKNLPAEKHHKKLE